MAQLYDEHWMFHGPGFQGVREIDELGDDGVDGVVESLPTPGATLDYAGQLYGWWVMATERGNFLALPQSIEPHRAVRPAAARRPFRQPGAHHRAHRPHGHAPTSS